MDKHTRYLDPSGFQEVWLQELADLLRLFGRIHYKPQKKSIPRSSASRILPIWYAPTGYLLFKMEVSENVGGTLNHLESSSHFGCRSHMETSIE